MTYQLIYGYRDPLLHGPSTGHIAEGKSIDALLDRIHEQMVAHLHAHCKCEIAVPDWYLDLDKYQIVIPITAEEEYRIIFASEEGRIPVGFLRSWLLQQYRSVEDEHEKIAHKQARIQRIHEELMRKSKSK